MGWNKSTLWYNEIEKRVVNETLELCQEYRTFSFLSPWELKKL